MVVVSEIKKRSTSWKKFCISFWKSICKKRPKNGYPLKIYFSNLQVMQDGIKDLVEWFAWLKITLNAPISFEWQIWIENWLFLIKKSTTNFGTDHQGLIFILLKLKMDRYVTITVPRKKRDPLVHGYRGVGTRGAQGHVPPPNILTN